VHSSLNPTGDPAPAATPSRVARVFVFVVFLVLIAAPLAVRKFNAASDMTPSSSSVADAVARFGFALQEVSEQSGIQFEHEAPALDAKLDPIMPAVASYGAAVSVVDFDVDGWQDLYVTTSGVGARC